jgi:hypothetical protein
MRRRASSVQTRSAVSATAAAAATARYQQQQQQLLQLQEDLRKTENIIYLQLRFTLYYSERLLLCFIPRKLLFFISISLCKTFSSYAIGWLFYYGKFSHLILILFSCFSILFKFSIFL